MYKRNMGEIRRFVRALLFRYLHRVSGRSVCRNAFTMGLFIVCIFCDVAYAETIRGIFGVPSIQRLRELSRQKGEVDAATVMDNASVNAVFVPEDEETIKWFKGRGYKVYLPVNAFGGRGAWQKYPETRPVKADGSLLGIDTEDTGYGGICPTHQSWRADRLNHIKKLVSQYGDSIDGIWLDFIRYPGFWETKEPKIPDTCYCPRCLRKFQDDRKIKIPAGLNTGEAAAWIKENSPYEWMRWKKEQISSFVAEVKKILDYRQGNKIRLGVFVVPWTKGEKQNAISYSLGQDAFELSKMVDVLSPMVYHKMCGRPESWVGEMIQYYKEAVRCDLWPIVQSVDCKPEEFRNVLKFAGKSDADGILVLSYGGMQADLWDGLKAFQPPDNLIANPELTVHRGYELPAGWLTGKTGDDPAIKSTFFLKPVDNIRCLGITGGYDRKGVWSSNLPRGEAGKEYLFTGFMYRETWENGVYPSISIWGQEFYLNNHWTFRRFQPIKLYVTCPEATDELTFRFMNYNPGKTFLLGRPKLVNHTRYSHLTFFKKGEISGFYDKFFPVGIYGATRDNLEQIKKLAINTVIVSGEGKDLRNTIRECHRVGLKYVVSPPRDPDRLTVYLADLAVYARPSDVAFYVNDEPELVSFPVNQANDIYRMIKDRFPGAPTCMALVRPQKCRDYLEASDFFMMDQYPIPYSPMVWLSDSMDEAATDVGADRLVSVIQAFGGKQYTDEGWPRLPTWQEMDCLAFLSVVHGSRGIFFFSYPEISQTEEGRRSLGRVVGRLNQIYPWLLEKNVNQEVQVEMVSTYRLDPKGIPAVQCCIKEKDNERLLITVNTIGTYVEAKIKTEAVGKTSREVFSGEVYPLMDGVIRTAFQPYEVKAFLLKSR
ncbi:MAG: hypothetical protein WC560_09575 [Syntrophales bacterium]